MNEFIGELKKVYADYFGDGSKIGSIDNETLSVLLKHTDSECQSFIFHFRTVLGLLFEFMVSRSDPKTLKIIDDGSYVITGNYDWLNGYRNYLIDRWDRYEWVVNKVRYSSWFSSKDDPNRFAEIINYVATNYFSKIFI